MFLGHYTGVHIKKMHPKDKLLGDFYKAVEQAYVSSAEYLQCKLPLRNKALKTLCGIDLCLRSEAFTIKILKRLPSILTTVLKEEDFPRYEEEVRRYLVDPTLPDTGKHIDHWWAEVGQKYPTLFTKLTVAREWEEMVALLQSTYYYYYFINISLRFSGNSYCKQTESKICFICHQNKFGKGETNWCNHVKCV